MKKNILFAISIILLYGCGEKEIINLSSPGNCITATSQCNICGRESVDGLFSCTEAFCENEEFTCIEYGSDFSKDNNYGEYCEKDSDCFCNKDNSSLEGCYYKIGQVDICKDNICTKGFEEN